MPMVGQQYYFMLMLDNLCQMHAAATGMLPSVPLPPTQHIVAMQDEHLCQ